MTETQIKEYLNKYSLATKEKLVEHIQQLKKNTKPNLELISELNYVLVDEENLFFSVFCGEKNTIPDCTLKKGYEISYNREPESKEKTLEERLTVKTFNDNASKNPWYVFDDTFDKTYPKNFVLLELKPKIVGDLEGINKPPQKRLNMHIDEVLQDLAQKETERNFKVETVKVEISEDDDVQRINEVIKLINSDKFKKDCDRVKEDISIRFENEGIPFNYKIAEKNIKTEETKGHSTRLKANTSIKIECNTFQNGIPCETLPNKYTQKDINEALEKLSNRGIKEIEGKLYYELSWEFIEEMAKRMANNKSDKYPPYNWKKNIDVEDLKQAINRHHIEVMKGNYKDGDEVLGHIVSYACNSMMLWEQLNKC